MMTMRLWRQWWTRRPSSMQEAEACSRKAFDTHEKPATRGEKAKKKTSSPPSWSSSRLKSTSKLNEEPNEWDEVTTPVLAVQSLPVCHARHANKILIQSIYMVCIYTTYFLVVLSTRIHTRLLCPSVTKSKKKKWNLKKNGCPSVSLKIQKKKEFHSNQYTTSLQIKTSLFFIPWRLLLCC